MGNHVRLTKRGAVVFPISHNREKHDNIFQVSPEYDHTLLNKERETAFHHTVAQLLFFMSRAMKDIKMTIDFLCTLVRIPDEDD